MHPAEKDALLLDQRTGLAVPADVPEPSDALPMTFPGLPLLLLLPLPLLLLPLPLLLRDSQGGVRVFQNICRHQGMILVSEPRRTKGVIRCPCHSWCYWTKGDLVATPHVGGPGDNIHDGIDRTTLGLLKVHSHIWRDVVWINASCDAPAFLEAMHDVITRWAA